MVISQPTAAHVTYRLLSIIVHDDEEFVINIGTSYNVKGIGDVFLICINANYKCKRYILFMLDIYLYLSE